MDISGTPESNCGCFFISLLIERFATIKSHQKAKGAALTARALPTFLRKVQL